MNGKTSALRGKIVEEYHTIAAFSDAIGWSRRKGSYVATGRQCMTVNEVARCAEMLNINKAEDFMRIFFPEVSIIWTDEKGA